VTFVDYDSDTIIAEMTSDLEARLGKTVSPGSPERLLILWMADIITQIKANIDISAKENVPRFASGDKLDSLAELFHDVTRLSASAATTTMRFYLSQAQSSAQLIPVGTRITTSDGNITFETENDVYVSSGNTYVDVAATCQSVGTIGNGYVSGQINRLVDIFPWYDHCENITTSAGGSENESDSDFYARMRESEDTYSTAGPMGGYVYFAKTASSSIIDVVANSPTPGVVNVYTLWAGGKLPGKEELNIVYEKIADDSIRPLTDSVHSLAPEPISYDVDLTYYIPSDSNKSASVIEAAVSAAVEEYKSWQSAKIGRDINPSKLYELLMTAGVKRVEVRCPEFRKLSDGKQTAEDSYLTAQVAQIGSCSVVNGGYEDE
jgi:phage-related baseplate assembly protein